MPELRLNLISREWVAILTDRPRDPSEFRTRTAVRHLPEHSETCPFCVGNESKTPEELMRTPATGQWHVRVTPNKYSVLSTEGERIRYTNGMKRAITGVGRHEVIVETERHDLTMAQMEVPRINEVISAYKERFHEAFFDRRIQHVILFKNHGADSGTNITHPHSQLVGLPVMPLEIRYRVDEAMRFFDNTGQCLMCSVIKDEMEEGKRVIVDTDAFISVVPYAAISPFHLWIFPKRHMASFGNITDSETEDLARNLKQTLGKIYYGLDDPSFNMVLRSLSPYRSRSEYVHWYISIVPRVFKTTGMELGSGIFVNPTVPEQVAEFLRGVKLP